MHVPQPHEIVGREIALYEGRKLGPVGKIVAADHAVVTVDVRGERRDLPAFLVEHKTTSTPRGDELAYETLVYFDFPDKPKNVEDAVFFNSLDFLLHVNSASSCADRLRHIAARFGSYFTDPEGYVVLLHHEAVRYRGERGYYGRVVSEWQLSQLGWPRALRYEADIKIARLIALLKEAGLVERDASEFVSRGVPRRQVSPFYGLVKKR